MNELFKQANDKINHRMVEISRDLSRRVGVSTVELASRGALKSGAALIKIASDCAQAYDDAVACINAEFGWVFNESLYMRESSALKLIDLGLGHIKQIESVITPQIEKISLTAQAGAGAQGAIRMQMLTKREQSEEAIRLFVRQKRIEKPRGLLRGVLSILFPLLRKKSDS